MLEYLIEDRETCGWEGLPKVPDKIFWRPTEGLRQMIAVCAKLMALSTFFPGIFLRSLFFNELVVPMQLFQFDLGVDSSTTQSREGLCMTLWNNTWRFHSPCQLVVEKHSV
jgi:hypothetical protein